MSGGFQGMSGMLGFQGMSGLGGGGCACVVGVGIPWEKPMELPGKIWDGSGSWCQCENLELPQEKKWEKFHVFPLFRKENLLKNKNQEKKLGKIPYFPTFPEGKPP